MRFLSFNLWHGLTPSNPVAFEALESTGRLELRRAMQLELLQKLKVDIGFLQEVNPATQRIREFSEVLKFSCTVQPDLVGLKLFGLGLPLNLNSGLVTFTSSNLSLKKVAGVSLSRPGTHWVHSWASWQLKEERFALFSETILPKWGRVLLVNTHLHHGLESTPQFEEQLVELGEELDLSPSAVTELKLRLRAGQARRLQELKVLLEELQRREKRYEVVVLGGDLNCSPFGPEAELLRAAGFQDAWQEANGEAPGYSYDGSVNVANHILQERFPLTLVVEDLSFDPKVKEALLKLARRQESRPRRIDYLWIKSRSLKLKVQQAQLVGLPDAEGLAPSDHFGVCADIEVE